MVVLCVLCVWGLQVECSFGMRSLSGTQIFFSQASVTSHTTTVMYIYLTPKSPSTSLIAPPPQDLTVHSNLVNLNLIKI